MAVWIAGISLVIGFVFGWSRREWTELRPYYGWSRLLLEILVLVTALVEAEMLRYRYPDQRVLGMAVSATTGLLGGYLFLRLIIVVVKATIRRPVTTNPGSTGSANTFKRNK